MSVTVTIPIEETSPATCTLAYTVQYKRSIDQAYQTLFPSPFTSPIVVHGLLEDSTYDFIITRQCCNLAPSDPLSFQVSTVLTP